MRALDLAGPRPVQSGEMPKIVDKAVRFQRLALNAKETTNGTEASTGFPEPSRLVSWFQMYQQRHPTLAASEIRIDGVNVSLQDCLDASSDEAACQQLASGLEKAEQARDPVSSTGDPPGDPPADTTTTPILVVERRPAADVIWLPWFLLALGILFICVLCGFGWYYYYPSEGRLSRAERRARGEYTRLENVEMREKSKGW